LRKWIELLRKQESKPNPPRKEEQISRSKGTEIRNPSRGYPLKESRGKPSDLPTRDVIQEFSFQLRDELKVKVQAELPNGWQPELEEISRQLRVKKLELYRIILGELLGKLKPKPNT
jgi:hypothetical protein